MKKINDNASGMLAAMAHYIESLVASRDFTGAVRYYDDNRRELEATGDPAAGVVLRLAARAYASLAQYPSALKLARKAQAIISDRGDSVELAETFMVIAETLRDMGELKEAEKAFRDAESIFRRKDCPEGQSRALNLLAGLFFRRNEYRNSLSILMDAMVIAKRLNDRPKLAFMMGNIGRLQTFLGDFAEAKRHLRINIEISEELGQDLELARAYMSLGYVHTQEGDYDAAEAALGFAAEGLKRHNSPRDEVMLRTYVGELHYRAGRLDDSRQVLEQALVQAEGIAPDTTLVGRVLRHLAELSVRTNSLTSASRYAARAMAIFDRHEDVVETGALVKIKAIVADRSDKPEEARREFIRALDLLEQSGVRFEKAEALIAAGQAETIEVRKRMTYLFRAEEFYRANGIEIRLQHVDRLLALIDLPAGSRSRPVCSGTAVADAEYITNNAEIKAFKKQLAYVAESDTDLPILLTGETGVGKDRMARHFHALCRPGKPFVVVNTASIPETLLESELFGHVRGAFTGADSDKCGLMAAANGGVLYLDEIGDMPLTLQVKLLGVLESRKVIPVGSTKEVPLDVRLVIATNRDLEAMVERGEFRKDLYYRISGISFHIPALRERKEDIPLLLKRFLSEYGLAVPEKLDPEIVQRFMENDWSGNVRELKNMVKRLEVMSELAAEGDLTELTRTIFDEGQVASKRSSLFEQVEEFECQILKEALLAADGNKSEAARILGIHEATVRTKLKRYGISSQGGAVN